MKNNNKRRSLIWKIPKEKFVSILKSCDSLSEALRHFNLGDRNGNHKTIKARILEENIDISHMNPHSGKFHIKYSLSEILIENSTYTNRTRLKIRLIREGLLDEKCHKCDLGPEWNGLPLTLQLEHKNGINNDNRLDNLALICPNCHTQTLTYAGKNTRKSTLLNIHNKRHFKYTELNFIQETKKPKTIDNLENSLSVNILKEDNLFCNNCDKSISRNSKNNLCTSCFSFSQRKTNRPSKDELLNLILTYPFTALSKQFGVSDNAIRKWCKQYNLPYRKQDIKAYINQHKLELLVE